MVIQFKLLFKDKEIYEVKSQKILLLPLIKKIDILQKTKDMKYELHTVLLFHHSFQP